MSGCECKTGGAKLREHRQGRELMIGYQSAGLRNLLKRRERTTGNIAIGPTEVTRCM